MNIYCMQTSPTSLIIIEPENVAGKAKLAVCRVVTFSARPASLHNLQQRPLWAILVTQSQSVYTEVSFGLNSS